MTARLLVVLEPTRPRHYALERALVSANADGQPVTLDILLASNPTGTAPEADEPLFRDRQWFMDLIAPLDESGLDYSLHITWSTRFQEAVLALADQVRPEIILVPVSERAPSGPLRFSDEKWSLLRHAPCPVLIVQPGAKARREVVLAALRTQSGDNNKYSELNQRIIAHSRRAAEIYGAELHVVNAYKSQDDFPDRSELLRMTGLSNDRIHLEPGAPATAVSEVAARIGADIVVIGTRRRSGLIATMRGNTSERLIGEIAQDVLTVN